MLPRVINIRQVRRNCFCVTSLSLILANLSLSLYIYILQNDASVRVLYRKRSNEVEKLFSFNELSLDATGVYLINRDVNLGAIKSDRQVVTLLTHCTMSNLAYLPLLLKNWDGPASVAVFVDTLDDFTLLLKAFAVCNLSLITRVALHVVRPVERASLKNAYLIQDIELSTLYENPTTFCLKLESLLLELRDKKENYKSPDPYPNNLLRNVASFGASTNFVFHVDIDMMPSKDLYAQFKSFVANNTTSSHEKYAYIIPAFEIDSSSFYRYRDQFPLVKSSLLNLVNQGIVRPFYSEVCQHCQQRTLYPKWLSLKQHPTKSLHIAYTVEWGHAYEPFFISLHDSTPAYDERFKQYGYNRISLLCELHVAEWTFKVFDIAFILHIGFKSNNSFPSDSHNAMKRNWKHYADFRKEIESKYAESLRNCDIPQNYLL